MSWADVGQIALASIVSAGGIGGIIVGVVKYSTTRIADRMNAKFEATLNKELEKYKSDLNKKEYVSKTKFDTEFSLYRELSVAFADMVRNISILIPPGYTMVPANNKDRMEIDKKHYEVAAPSFVKAQDTLFANVPFISEAIYNGYEEVLKLCLLQLGEYEERFNVYDLRPKEEKEHFSREAYARAREINTKWKTLNTQIRTYISSLDVLEDK